MGCWNGTCAISNLHVTAGQDVAVFMLAKQKNSDNSFCYSNALYDVCPVPFYGKYNDYGGVEECHGFGLDIVVEAIREQLYEFGQGPNEYHDIEVNKATFDIEQLFEADHEGRLGIEDNRNWSSEEYDLRELERKRDSDDGLTASQRFELDRLANKIKKVDAFRQVTHVIIHGDIFRAIMNEWYIEEFVGEGKGTHGYDNNYTQTYFKDIVDSIPEYVRRVREYEKGSIGGNGAFMAAWGRRSIFEWNDPCLAGRWMRTFINGGESSPWGIIDVNDYINEKILDSIDDSKWEVLASFAKEVLTAAWVNSFMSYTRKLWSKQSGSGSQNSDPDGYIVLSKAVLGVLATERAEQEEYEREDEEDEEEVNDNAHPTYIEP